MLNVTEVAVQEWLRNPVTQSVLEMLVQRLSNREAVAGRIFYRGEPQKTHDAILENESQIGEIEQILGIFDEETLKSEVESLGYAQWNPTRRLQDTD